MNQFDNYELTTIDYTLKYYLEHNEMLDDEDIEWCKLVREKVDSIIVSQAKYDMECGQDNLITVTTIIVIGSLSIIIGIYKGDTPYENHI